MTFFSWLGKNEDDSTMPASHKKSNPIQFHPTLVADLIKDHRELIILYQEILEHHHQQEYDEIGEKLFRFKRALQAHAVVENTKFYTYLENELSDPDLSFVRDMHKEMNRITRSVSRFVRQYQNLKFDAATQECFIEGFADIGQILTDRIEQEESDLYKLYEH